jgi:hypothetical protein
MSKQRREQQSFNFTDDDVADDIPASAPSVSVSPETTERT